MDAGALLSERLGQAAFTRVVAFGSSNTERRLAGMHWFDCFELAARNTYGPHLVCINSGTGGDSTRDLLQRFERDCLGYHPHLVFITIGGNDAWPEKGISVAEYRQNLMSIINTLHARECAVVLQTYYAMDMDNMPAEYTANFFAGMDAVREVSAAMGCMLIDHHARWEALRLQVYDRYAAMLCDRMHVNTLGNLVMGLDIVRAFGLQLPEDVYFREAAMAQALLDRLTGEKSVVA